MVVVVMIIIIIIIEPYAEENLKESIYVTL